MASLAPRRLVTHADRMPLDMHTHRLARSSHNPRTRRYYLGSYEWTPEFAAWLGTSVAASLPAPRQVHRVPADQWWRSPYVTARLATHFPPALIDALVALHTRQADETTWERLAWEGDDEALEARQMTLFSEATAIATAARTALELPTLTHERALSWLVREGEHVQQAVYRRYYPSRRRPA